jgi:hypothetical protein
VRLSATFSAYLVLWALGSCAAQPIAPPLPQGRWKLQVCLSQGYTSIQPCAYLDDRLILRVESPAVPPGQQGPVVFEQHISQEVAQRIYISALAAIRSFNSTPGREVLDGALVSVTLTAAVNTAHVEFGDSDVSKMSPAVRELNGLLNETTHAF